MKSVLRFSGAHLVHMDAGTYAWVDLKHFDLLTSVDDVDVLVALLADPQYRDDYAGGGPNGDASIHGPYVLPDIKASSFTRVTGAVAVGVLSKWADKVNGPNGPSVASDDVKARLAAEVFPHFQSESVYRLEPVAHHEWGWVVGIGGFHEFVIVDHESRMVTLAVAADD